MRKAHMTSFEIFEISNLIYFLYLITIFNIFFLKMIQYDKIQHLHIIV